MHVLLSPSFMIVKLTVMHRVSFLFCYVVYALWKWPYILGYITTWPPVLKKLQNGASKPGQPFA